ncbi:MAG: hypothetical protein HYT76_06245 [Deltaproteobacteria bacterium]|nr:hypothetical protein [Deltaproteobacteria bacterium]
MSNRSETVPSAASRLITIFSRFAGVPLKYDPGESHRGRIVSEHPFSERPYNATTFTIAETGEDLYLLGGREVGRSRFLAGVFVPRAVGEEIWVHKRGFLETVAGDRRNFDVRLTYGATEGRLDLQEVMITRTRFRKPPLRIYVDLSTPKHAYLVARGRRIGHLNYRMEENLLHLSGDVLDRFLGMGGPTVTEATVTLPNIGRLPSRGRVRAMRLLQRTISGLTFATKARFGNPVGWTETALKSKSLPGVVTVMAMGLGTLLMTGVINSLSTSV